MFGLTPKVQLPVQEAPAGTVPVCPACKQDLATVWRAPLGPQMTLLDFKFGKQALMCPHCRVLLGFE